jgi:alpha-L-fucosidase
MNKLKSLLVAISITLSVFAQTDNLPMREGKFKPTDESLKQYKYPEWFRDAKFGIWSHWGPQAVPGKDGGMYSRRMYESAWYDCEKNEYHQAHPCYIYHLEHYGHPSEFGYKDILSLWKAEKWEPEELMKLFKRAGARYFVSMGVHCDNFFLWNSKLHRWNSVKIGPQKDIVGEWQQAAQKEGLYFGVSEHLSHSYTWFQLSHGSDQLGDKAGIPYDGNNSEYQDLYYGKGMLPLEWQRQWYDRIQELIDMYHPDLLYTDSDLPFGNVGKTLLTHYYNTGLEYNKKGVVYNCKISDSEGRWVKDYEKGSAEGIQQYPWQTDITIGATWYFDLYKKNWKSGKEIIQMLIDIVSKNGNLLLDVVQTPEGDLEDEVVQTLEEVAVWMADNGDAIYGTRPWKVYGEGQSVTLEQEKGEFDGIKAVRAYQQGDLRFTVKDKTLYTFYMEKPKGEIHIQSLGLKTATGRKVKSITMLGSKETIKWTQDDNEVVIQKPAQLPEYDTIVFAIR